MADTKEIINCPACGKPMAKIPVPAANINLDICLDGCGGIFFDNREFKKFDEQAESIDEITNAIIGKTFAPVDGNADRTCPVCGMKMVKNFASSLHEIQIDECYGCGGKFLDNGELQKIRAQFATEQERADAAVKELYNAVGGKLKALDEEWAVAKARRSPLNNLFNSLMGID